jgi:hypothetical protein
MKAPKIYEVEDIEFVKPERAVGDWVILTNVEAFDEAWRAHEPDYYIEYRGANSRQKYLGFANWFEDNPDIPVEMPEVVMYEDPASGRDWGPGFTNGRHRFAFLRDMGMPVIPMAVSRHGAQRFKKVFGA